MLIVDPLFRPERSENLSHRNVTRVNDSLRFNDISRALEIGSGVSNLFLLGLWLNIKNRVE